MMLPQLDAFITQIYIDVNCYQCGDVSSSMTVEVKKEMKHMYMCVQLQIRYPSNLLYIYIYALVNAEILGLVKRDYTY